MANTVQPSWIKPTYNHSILEFVFISFLCSVQNVTPRRWRSCRREAVWTSASCRNSRTHLCPGDSEKSRSPSLAYPPPALVRVCDKTTRHIAPPARRNEAEMWVNGVGWNEVVNGAGGVFCIHICLKSTNRSVHICSETELAYDHGEVYLITRFVTTGGWGGGNKHCWGNAAGLKSWLGTPSAKLDRIRVGTWHRSYFKINKKREEARIFWFRKNEKRIK